MCKRLLPLCLLALAAVLPAHADECSGGFSVLRQPQSSCAEPSPPNGPPPQRSTAPATHSPIDEDWLKAEMAAFTVIGIAQVRGGTDLLANIWYAGAIVVPPVLVSDARYGMKKNYLAITPPFLALGAINAWLDRTGAKDPRIFLTNFIGFNIGMLWSQKVLSEPQKFFGARTTATVALLPPRFLVEHSDAYGLRYELRF